MASDQTKKTKKRTQREYVVDLDDGGSGMTRTLVYAVGAVAGLALGAVLAKGMGGELGRGAAEGIRRAGRRMRPGRLRRTAGEVELLVELEDRVLDAFLADRVLSEEGIDVGVVAPGVVELSGRVSDREAARRALREAQRLEGVWSVLNRMEIADGDDAALAPEDEDADRGSGAEWTGLRSGMGTRRQGRSTDPFRNDDSQHQRERAVEKADRDQWEDEGYHHRPRMAARGNDPREPDYREGELDNQSPYGKHATPRSPREERNSGARVGEGLKPGTELRLEGSDVPLKPHQRAAGDEERGV